MRKFTIIAAFAIIMNTCYAQKSKWGVEVMGVEKTNYSFYYAKQHYQNDQSLGNYLFFQPDFNISLKHCFKNFNIKLGFTYINNMWKNYKDDTIHINEYYTPYSWGYEVVYYKGTRIVKEKSILIPLSIEKKLFLNNKKSKWFYSIELGLAYQYVFWINNYVESFVSNCSYNDISDLELKNRIYKNSFYTEKSVLTRQDFRFYDKANKDMFQVFMINGIGCQLNKHLNASLNLVNRMNLKRTKTSNDPETKRWDGSVGLGFRVGVDF